MLSLVFVGITAISIIAAFFIAYVVYDRYCFDKDGKERSFILFILGMLLSSYLGTGLIGAAALNFACPNNSGAGCSFGFAAISFPIFAGISIAAFLFVWASLGRRAEKS